LDDAAPESSLSSMGAPKRPRRGGTCDRGYGSGERALHLRGWVSRADWPSCRAVLETSRGGKRGFRWGPASGTAAASTGGQQALGCSGCGRSGHGNERVECLERPAPRPWAALKQAQPAWSRPFGATEDGHGERV